MLSSHPTTAHDVSVVNVRLPLSEYAQYIGFLTKLNTLDAAAAAAFIAKERTYHLGSALLFAIAHGLPKAVDYLWKNGASAYKDAEYQVYSDVLIPRTTLGKAGDPREQQVTLLSTAFFRLQSITLQNPEKIDATIDELTALIAKNSEWNEANFNVMLSYMVYENFSTDCYKRLLPALLQPNIISRIAKRYFNILNEVIDDRPANIILLEHLLSHPEIKPLLEQADKESHKTPLQSAASHGHAKIIQLLLAHGAQVNASNSEGVTALHCAASGGHIAATKLLLDAGANVNAQTATGITPLHYAASFGTSLIFRITPVKEKALPKITAKEYEAKASAHTMILRLLLAAGADPRLETNVMATALYWAAAVNHLDAVKLLIERDKTLIKTCPAGSAIDAFCYFRIETLPEKANPGSSMMRTFMQLGARREIRHRPTERRINSSLRRTDFAILYWLSGAAYANEEYIVAIRQGNHAKLTEGLSSDIARDPVWMQEALVNAIAFAQVDIVAELLKRGASALTWFCHYSMVDIALLCNQEHAAHALKSLLKTAAERETILTITPAQAAAKTSDSLEASASAAPIATPVRAIPAPDDYKRHSAEPSSQQDYVTDLLNNLAEELNFAREHLQKGEIAEAQDCLSLLKKLLRKMLPYQAESLYWRNEYNRYHHNLEKLQIRIDRLSIAHSSPSPAVAATGAGSEITQASTPAAVTTELPATPTTISLEAFAERDLCQRIAQAGNSPDETALLAAQYNLIRLFELWTTQALGFGCAYWLRQHVLHHHFATDPADYRTLAQALSHEVPRSETELNKFLRKTAYFQKYIAAQGNTFFIDRRDDTAKIRHFYATLSHIVSVHDRLKRATSDAKAYLEDAIRMLVVIAGELLRDQDDSSNPVRDSLSMHMADKIARLDEFCDAVCHARNLACHTHNARASTGPEKFIIQARPSIRSLEKILHTAATIVHVLAKPSPTPLLAAAKMSACATITSTGPII